MSTHAEDSDLRDGHQIRLEDGGGTHRTTPLVVCPGASVGPCGIDFPSVNRTASRRECLLHRNRGKRACTFDERFGAERWIAMCYALAVPQRACTFGDATGTAIRQRLDGYDARVV